MKKIGKTLAVCLTASVLAVSSAVSASAAAFSDVSGHWAEATISRWVDLGYINGYPDGTFRPREPITRTEFAVVANHAFNFQNRQAIYFPDVAETFWGYAEIQKAYSAGYMRGDTNGTFRPRANVTRQEAAVMLANIKGLSVGGSAPYYSDSDSISSWARGSVNAVSAAGYMSGYPDGSFRPKSQISRAEVVTMLNKALGAGGTTTNPYVPPTQSTTDSVQNMTLQNTTLRNTIVNGDLTIPSSMSSRSITLDNVTVRGKLNLEGGGTITAEDCVINELVMDKSSAVFRAEDGTSVAKTTFRANGTLEGDRFQDVSIANSKVNTVTIDAEVENLTLDTDADMRLYGGAEIETFEITKNADDALIELSRGARVRNMNIRDGVRIAGDGDIDNMTVYVSGVRSEIEPDSLSRRSGAGKPDFDWEYSGKRHESSGSGSSSSSSSNRTISKDFDGDGATYRNVTVTDDADVEDMRVTGNLTIDKDVENGTVTLKDVRVDGNVYVYGGGSSSVIFRNCDIRGDIISDKDSSASRSQVVALRFDSSTEVRGEIRIQNDTILDVYSGSPELDNVVVEERNVELDVDIDIDTLTLEERGAQVNVRNGVTIDTLKTNRGIGESRIDMDGSSVIRTVDARSDVDIRGTGTVNRVNKDSGVDVTLGSGIKNEPEQPSKPGSVTSVTLNKDKGQVAVKGTLKLTATVTTPDSGTDQTVTWSSSDTTKATVSADGTVTGVAVTESNKPVTITATSKADDTKSAACQITVVAEGTLPDNPDGPDAPVTVPTLSPSVVSVQKNATVTLTVEFPADYDEVWQDIVWTVSGNENSIALTENETKDKRIRKLTAKEKGKAKVTATIKGEGDETLLETSSDITVTDTTGTSTLLGVNIGKRENGPAVSKLNVKVGTNTTQLAAMLEPSNASFSVIKWRSSDPSVVDPNLKDLEDGTRTYLEAKKIGKADITLTAIPSGAGEDAEGYSATCEVEVTEDGANIPVESVTISPDNVSLEAGATRTLTAVITPSNATNQKVTWSSSKTDVATVDPNSGLVRAIAQGTAVITASVDGQKAERTVTVTPRNPVAVTRVTLNKPSLSLVAGGTNGTLTATVEPASADNQEVEWAISESTPAGVIEISPADKTCTVKPKIAGTAKVTVTTKDGRKTATCTVTVGEAGSLTISLPKTAEIEMLPTGKATLTPTVTPGDESSASWITWASSDETVATVNAGEITALKPGVTTITATVTKGGKTAEDTCQVTIKPGLALTYKGSEITNALQATPDGKITLGVQKLPTNADLDYGVVNRGTKETPSWADKNDFVFEEATGDLTLEIPNNATTGNYTLSVVASVQVDGTTTLTTEKLIEFDVISKPTVTITGTANQSAAPGGTVEYTYTVNPAGRAVEFMFTVMHNGGAELEDTGWKKKPVKAENGKITVTVPSDAPPGAYTLKVENEPLSAIKAERITPSEFSFTVTGSENPSAGGEIQLDKSALTFYLQKLDGNVVTPSQTITATLPSDIDNETVTWDLTNCDWLEKESQNDTGTHTAKFKLKASEFTGWSTTSGNYYITATAGGKTATCNVEVKCEQAKGIELDKETLTVTVGAEAEILTATVQPGDKARDLSVAWEKSDSGETDQYISIDYSEKSNVCKVTALKPTAMGNTVTINARTDDWTQGYATCAVTVVAENARTRTGDTPAEPSNESQSNAAEQAATQNTVQQSTAPAMSVRQNTVQTVQQQAAPRTFSFIPQRELQSKPTAPVVTVEPEQEPANEPVKEPEKVQEPEKEPVQEPVKEPETAQESEKTTEPEQTPEQNQGIVLTCADSFKAGESLTLSGTVNGVSGALRKIDWSIRDAGATGAAIRDGVMSAERAGTVTIAATVQNSTTTEIFTITVLPGDEPKADEPIAQEPVQTEPQAPAEDTQPETPAEGTADPVNPAEGQEPAVVTPPAVQTGAVTLPNGQVIPNAKKLQRSVGTAIVLSGLDALPANAAADSVVWKAESLGTTGAALQMQDNTLVSLNANTAGVIILSRTVKVTNADGSTAIKTTYYEITVA